jgi:hypothetical protein
VRGVRDIDQPEVVERLPVGGLDVPDPIVVLGEDRTGFGLDDREIAVLARECSDRAPGGWAAAEGGTRWIPRVRFSGS